MSLPTLFRSDWNKEIYLIEVGIPGPAGDGFTATEAADVRTRLTSLEGRANVSTLESLTNVPDSGAVAGQSIIKAADGWVYGNPNSSLRNVGDSNGSNVPDATVLTTGPGLIVTQEASAIGKRAHVALDTGSSGTSTKVARADHIHAGPIQHLAPIPYQGVLSSGYRDIYVGSIPGMVASEIYDIQLSVTFDVISAGVESVITPRTQVGVASFVGYDVAFKGVQGKTITLHNAATGITNVLGYPITVRVFYKSGPQVEIGGGQVLAIARPRR